MKQPSSKSSAAAVVVILLVFYAGSSGPLAGVAFRRTNSANGINWYEKHLYFYAPLTWLCRHTGSEQFLEAYWKYWGWSDMVDTG